MKGKNLLELLTLSTNLYMISKDEELMEYLSEMMKKGKDKVNGFIEEVPEENKDGDERLIQKLLHKAKQAKGEFEKKMEDVAIKVYGKMHIAHTDDLKNVLQRLEIMEKKLNLIEAQVASFSPKNF